VPPSDDVKLNGTGRGSRHTASVLLRDPSHTRIALAGELDLYTIADTRRVLEAECERRPERLIVDLAAIEFLDSQGLHLFAEIHQRLARSGCVLMLVSPPEHVSRMFAMTGLDNLLLVQ
jgi:anti-sigma B factor antagonist